MFWKKKNQQEPEPVAPLEPKKWTIPVSTAELNQLAPDKRYVFWFNRPLEPEHLSMIRRALESLGIRAVVFTGIHKPEIYELRPDYDGTMGGPAADTG